MITKCFVIVVQVIKHKRFTRERLQLCLDCKITKRYARHFSKYRQVSRGWFLVSLNEVNNSNSVLKINSVLK